MFDEPRRFARRIGFAIVVVGSRGELIAFGNGRPPEWIQTAAAAEAWAFYQVVSMNPAVPVVITDCKDILNALMAGKAAATSAERRLARVWHMIFHALDGGDLVDEASLLWMPAHGSCASIGRALRSDGQPISGLDWRANRLADALAKAAAGFDGIPANLLRQVSAAADALEYSVARLGAVTWACNHHKVLVARPDGSQGWRTVRDSCPAKAPATTSQHTQQGLRRPPACQDDHQGSASNVATAVLQMVPPHRCAVARVPRRTSLGSAVAMATSQAQRQDATVLAEWLASRNLQPRVGPAAAERLASVRERVRQREAQAACIASVPEGSEV